MPSELRLALKPKPVSPESIEGRGRRSIYTALPDFTNHTRTLYR